MLVYFIRHGSTTLGEEKRHQFSDTPLSERGRREASQVSDRLQNLSFDSLITSPFTRAAETAGIINKHHNKNIEICDSFMETVQPSGVLGKEYTDPYVSKISNKLKAHKDDPDWRYSDEETFNDIKNRAIKAIKVLEDHETENIVVTLHGDILRVILSVMQYGEDLDSKLFYNFRTFAPTRHTGITTCKFDNENGWKLVTWNDHSHLI